MSKGRSIRARYGTGQMTRGQCPECRFYVPVLKDGTTLRKHKAYTTVALRPVLYGVCAGSGQPKVDKG